MERWRRNQREILVDEWKGGEVDGDKEWGADKTEVTCRWVEGKR